MRERQLYPRLPAEQVTIADRYTEEQCLYSPPPVIAVTGHLLSPLHVTRLTSA